jgi:CPA2 family monovalent cation:H+ antiporter-2
MLFDPVVPVEQPLHVLGVVAIILGGKSIAALVIVLAFRYPLNTAFTVAARLAQIGESSFILAGLGMTLGLLPAEGMSLVLAGALISVARNPFVFAAIAPFRSWVPERSAPARRFEGRPDPLAELPMSTVDRYLKGQIVLVGLGRVDQRIANALNEQGVPYAVVEQNRDQVEDLRDKGISAVAGDAADPAVLIQAYVANEARAGTVAGGPGRSCGTRGAKDG